MLRVGRGRSALGPFATHGGGYPRDLFASAATIGGFYDYDDFDYLYQKSDGSVPVTALEQPVGFMQDKRYGGAVGDERMATGTVGLQGAATAATYNTSTGVGTASRVNVSNQSYVGFAFGTGKFARVSIVNTGATTLLVRLLDAGGVSGGWAIVTAGSTFNGFVLSGTSGVCVAAGGDETTASFTVNSVRELPGLHAYQSTDAARPVISARYNLLLATEDLAGASWAKTAAGTGVAPTVTNNYATAPDGTQTAARVQLSLGGGSTDSDRSYLSQSVTFLAGGYTNKVYVKANGAGEVGKKILHRSAAASGYTTTTLTADWQLISWAETAAGGAVAVELIALRGATGSSSSTADVLVWHPDVRLTIDANARLPAYQRVTTATDYDSAGFPRFLRIDATDDFMQTASVDPGTDKVFVCAGVTKVSDAATGTVVESSASSSTNNGSFAVFASRGAIAAYGTNSRGTVTSTLDSATTFSAPNSAILSFVAGIGADTNRLRVNAAEQTPSAVDQGTGNFTAQPIYIGMRAGSSLGLNNGRIYPMVICFKAVTAGEIAATEAWVNQRTKGF